MSSTFEACPQPVLIVQRVTLFNFPRMVTGPRKMGTLRDLSLLPSFSHITPTPTTVSEFWGEAPCWFPGRKNPVKRDA